MIQLSKRALGLFLRVRSENRTVRALNDGLINIIPLILVGAIATALINLPIPWFQDFLQAYTNGYWDDFGRILTFATLDVVGLAALLSISYEFARTEEIVSKGELSPFIPVFASLSCYLIVFVWDGTGDLVLRSAGTPGIFFAIITALCTNKVFFAFVRSVQIIRAHQSRELDANLQMRSVFRAIFPVTVTLIVAVLLRLALTAFLLATDLQTQLTDALTVHLVSDSYGSVVLTVLIMQVMWFFGIHGSDSVLPFFPTISELTEQGAEALSSVSASGIPLVPTDLPLFATQDFYFTFVSLGGAGATFGFLLALILVGSAHRGRRLAKATLFPSIFNINEILVYGAPIIFNPLVFVPFILAPVLVATISYIAFSLGLVAPIVHDVSWTTPILFSGYVATDSLTGSLLQLVSVACATLLYIPFVRLVRRSDQQARVQRFALLRSSALEAAENEFMTLITRTDSLGETARDFATELHEYFEQNKLPFYLVYQPKTDMTGHAIGAEALLRWEHPTYGPISPVMLIEMTDETNLSTSLGRWITETAITQYAQWKSAGMTDTGIASHPLRLSINLNPKHLAEDSTFPAYVATLLKRYNIAPGEIELEITEHVAVRSSLAMSNAFEKLRKAGALLSIDDMGMGYSSLTYISDYGVSAVKIDISLVDEIATNIQQREIVRSIVSLASQIDLEIIAEGVETREQVVVLHDLGVRYFQGYYFSHPLLPSDFEQYLSTNAS